MDAHLVAAWEGLCQALAPVFSRPVFGTFVHVLTGWVLCRSRPAVTNLVRTVGDQLLGQAAKHWTTYQKFFYRANWSLEDLSRQVLLQVVLPTLDACAPGAQVELKIDDSTCARHGRHVAFAGYFKDASASNTLKTVVHWAHNWVLGCITLRCSRWPRWVIGLPVWFALYRKAPDCDRAHPFQTRQQLAAQIIRQTRDLLPRRALQVAVDGQYATRAVVQAAREADADLVSRLRSDAALYALPARKPPHRRGRQAKKGRRLPTPQQMAARRRKGWRTLEVRAYGKVVRRQVLAVVCLWYHVSRERPIKLLIVRDPTGRQKDDYLFCTEPRVPDAQILEGFAARWPIEECIREAKQLGGFEQVQGWCPRTVERQAPLALIGQTLVKAWYLRYAVAAEAAQPASVHGGPGRRDKAHPSYLDMLATLRYALWRHRITPNSTLGARMHGFLETLRFTLCAAA